MTDHAIPDALRRDRPAALLIGASSLLMVGLMAHHPTWRDPGPVIQFVHGGLLLTLLAQAIGFSSFVEALPHRRLARAGWVAYLAGAAAMAAGGVINGFAMPGLVRHVAGDPAAARAAIHPVLDGFWALNQAFESAGVVAASIAVAIWSLPLIQQRGLARAFGVAGLLAGLAGMVVMLGGWLRLDIHGFGLVVLVIALWNLAVAVLLFWGRSDFGEHCPF